MMMPVMTLNGVRIFPLGFSSDRMNRTSPITVPVSGTAAAPAMFIGSWLFPMAALLGVLVPLFPGDEVVEPEQHRRPEDVDQGDANPGTPR